MTIRIPAASLVALATVLAFPAAASRKLTTLRRRLHQTGRTRGFDEIVVQAQIGYRNRDEDNAEPVLVYGTDYFQRFEPLTAGDA